MIFKVCGMKYQENIRKLQELAVDWMGLIFYPKSPRFVKHPLEFDNKTPKRIGVFVNADADYIETKIHKYALQGIQLHGNETPHLCNQLRRNDLLVIKVFSIDPSFDFASTLPYAEDVDYFLFDTKTPLKGGSGKRFNWSLLQNYDGEKDFILSGGIGPDDVQELKNLQHTRWAGIDVNSRFEVRPGLKDISKLKKFQHEFFS